MMLLRNRAFLMILLIWMPLLSNTMHIYGLQQNEFTISYQWSSSKYYQGELGSVIISLESTCGDELKFTWIGIHFEWLAENYYYSVDMSSNPLSIPSQGSCTFPSIRFDIPSTAKLGWNVYHINIHCQEHHWYGWTNEVWKSAGSSLMIYDAYEKIYYNTKPNVESKISQANSMNFEDTNARSLLQQVINERDLAVQLAGKNKWSEALTHLQFALNLIEQAIGAETTYWKNKAISDILGAQSKMTQFEKSESPEARNYATQANDKFLEAQNALSRQDYKTACQYATSASSLADQAIAAEKNYQTQKFNMIVIGVIGGVAAIVLVAVFYIRKKSK